MHKNLSPCELFICLISCFQWQRKRLEEQVRNHNDKRASNGSVSDSSEEKLKKSDDESYEVTLDDDFLTALEYGMPPASGMVLFSSFISYCISAFSVSYLESILVMNKNVKKLLYGWSTWILQVL